MAVNHQSTYYSNGKNGDWWVKLLTFERGVKFVSELSECVVAWLVVGNNVCTVPRSTWVLEKIITRVDRLIHGRQQPRCYSRYTTPAAARGVSSCTRLHYNEALLSLISSHLNWVRREATQFAMAATNQNQVCDLLNLLRFIVYFSYKSKIIWLYCVALCYYIWWNKVVC